MDFYKVLPDLIRISVPVINVVTSDFTLSWDIKELLGSLRRNVYFVPSNEYVNKAYLEQKGFFDHVLVEYNFDEKNRFQPYLAYIRESLDFLRSRKTTLVIFTNEPISESFVFQLKGPSVDLEKVYLDVLETFEKSYHRKIYISENFKKHLFTLVHGFSRVQAENIFYYALHRYMPSSEDRLLMELLEYKASEFSKVGLEILSPVSGGELGGFKRFKVYLSKIRKVFEQDSHVFPPKGVLLCGIPGTGKTLAAKVAGYYFGFPVVRLDVGRLLSKWLGESEKKFTTAIETVEVLAPVVVLVDEIEKVFSVGHEVTQRIMGNFLFWLQEKRADVYVIATANRLEMLPPELIRIGRWDKLFFVDLPDREQRQEIFAIHLAKVGAVFSDDELFLLVERSEGFTGAEIEQVVKNAYYEALALERPVSVDILMGSLSEVTPLSLYRKDEINVMRELLKKGWQEV